MCAPSTRGSDLTDSLAERRLGFPPSSGHLRGMESLVWPANTAADGRCLLVQCFLSWYSLACSIDRRDASSLRLQASTRRLCPRDTARSAIGGDR